MPHETYTGMDEAYASLCESVLAYGEEVSPRGFETLELIGNSFTIQNVTANVVTSKIRKISLPFMAAEFVWLLTGSNDVASIAPFNKNIAQFSDDGLTFAGAYGPKLVQQLPYVIDTLRQDPDSRQAVLTLWQPNPRTSKDTPCTILFQFFVRQRHGTRCVDMLVYMRSNDLWLGLPYDVFNFTCIQRYVAEALGYDHGHYHHHTGSLHLYKQHFELARRLVSEQAYNFNDSDPVAFPMPPQFQVMAKGIAILGNLRPVDVTSWLDTGAWNIDGFWGNMLELMAYRFHKNFNAINCHGYRLLAEHLK